MAAALACVLFSPAASALDEAELRGKQIYFEGTSPRGDEINAVVGEEATVLPAMAVPCVNCHGYDGLGRPEGGVVPTDIRWSQLEKPYGHVHLHGRRHGPFSDKDLARSIVAGVDPAGNRLDASMPVYLMSADDLEDLVAYIKVLEKDYDPGIDKDSVRVATLLPLDGRMAGLGQAMEAALKASIEEVNASGGVYGRNIEIVSVPLGTSIEASLDNLRSAFASPGIFALVSGYTVGIDEPLLDMLRPDSVPLVGPFTLDPGNAFADGNAFYLFPGFEEQVRVLADEALRNADDSRRVLVAAPQHASEDLQGIAEKRLELRGHEDTSTVTYAAGETAGLAEEIDSRGIDSVLFLGNDDELETLLAALDERGLNPAIFMLASHLSKPPFSAPASFDKRIFVAHPAIAADISPEGRAAYIALAERYSLPQGHIQAQTAAIAAARLLVEGLRRAGRNLSRSRLVEGVEAVYQFETGFTRPLIYGPNRRVGALGAHLLVVDIANKRYIPLDGESWRELD